MAALTEPAGRQAFHLPVGHGRIRRLVGDGKMTYRDWAHDPKKFAEPPSPATSTSTATGTIGLMDLSVMAGDLGCHVRMDDQNTPFVDQTIINNPEDYEKLQVPDVKKGRCGVLSRAPSMFVEALRTTSSPPVSSRDRCWR